MPKEISLRRNYPIIRKEPREYHLTKNDKNPAILIYEQMFNIFFLYEYTKENKKINDFFSLDSNLLLKENKKKINCENELFLSKVKIFLTSKIPPELVYEIFYYVRLNQINKLYSSWKSAFLTDDPNIDEIKKIIGIKTKIKEKETISLIKKINFNNKKNSLVNPNLFSSLRDLDENNLHARSKRTELFKTVRNCINDKKKQNFLNFEQFVKRELELDWFTNNLCSIEKHYQDLIKIFDDNDNYFSFLEKNEHASAKMKLRKDLICWLNEFKKYDLETHYLNCFKNWTALNDIELKNISFFYPEKFVIEEEYFIFFRNRLVILEEESGYIKFFLDFISDDFVKIFPNIFLVNNFEEQETILKVNLVWRFIICKISFLYFKRIYDSASKFKLSLQEKKGKQKETNSLNHDLIIEISSFMLQILSEENFSWNLSVNTEKINDDKEIDNFLNEINYKYKVGFRENEKVLKLDHRYGFDIKNWGGFKY